MEQEREIEQEMYRRAIDFIPQRYPKGWGGVTIIHSEDGQYFTSVAIETANTLKFVTLDKLQPYHWTSAYPAEELEHYHK